MITIRRITGAPKFKLKPKQQPHPVDALVIQPEIIMKVRLFSSTWTGTKQEEIIDLNEWGLEFDNIEELENDKQTMDELFEEALQQQNFDWGFELLEDE